MFLPVQKLPELPKCQKLAAVVQLDCVFELPAASSAAGSAAAVIVSVAANFAHSLLDSAMAAHS